MLTKQCPSPKNREWLSSIISNIEKITNPNTRAISLSEAGHGGHNNLFRSDASLDYIDGINIEYRKLYDLYEKNIPYEVKIDFYSKIDRFLAQDIDRELMDKIHIFFLRT